MNVARCPWYVAGPLLGLLIVGLRAAVNRPLGALGGTIEIADRSLGFRAFLLVGIVGGGALFAATLGSFVPSSGAGHPALLSVAGVAMGFGARTAGGRTSGHGMSGMSLGSPASIAASMTFFATAVALAHLLGSAP